jgi:hypothetical protein
MPQLERMSGEKNEQRRRKAQSWRRNRRVAVRALNLKTNAEIVCRAKTVRGNKFERPAQARSSARLLSREVGKTIEAYKCRVCRLWHIGKPTKR